MQLRAFIETLPFCERHLPSLNLNSIDSVHLNQYCQRQIGGLGGDLLPACRVHFLGITAPALLTHFSVDFVSDNHLAVWSNRGVNVARKRDCGWVRRLSIGRRWDNHDLTARFRRIEDPVVVVIDPYRHCVAAMDRVAALGCDCNAADVDRDRCRRPAWVAPMASTAITTTPRH